MEEIRNYSEVFGDTGYRLLNFSGDYDVFSGTTLRMKGNKYVILEDLYEEMDQEDLLLAVRTDEECDEDEDSLDGYVSDCTDEEIEKLVGILFPNDYLYEILYDFGMLGDKFYEEEKDNAVKGLLRTVYKVTSAFDYDLDFMDGRIYITSEKKPLDDGSFACEVEEAQRKIVEIAKKM